MRRAAGMLLVAVAALFAAGPALACDSCYGTATDSPLIDGAKMGAVLLLGVTLGVQGGFVAFFVHLKRRAQRFHDAQIDAEWDDLQRRDSTP